MPCPDPWASSRGSSVSGAMFAPSSMGRPADRVAVQASPPVDLAHREPTHEMQSPDLRPLLHSDQLVVPGSLCANEPEAPQTTRRLRWPRIQPAQVPSFHPAPTRAAAEV